MEGCTARNVSLSSALDASRVSGIMAWLSRGVVPCSFDGEPDEVGQTGSGELT